MPATSVASLKIPDITQCSICLETFKEPKVLPCIHTFCLHCLDGYSASKKPDEISCPLCRKFFVIPTGGVKELPNNFFINQLLQVNQSSVSNGAKKSDKPSLCELCSDSNTEITSTSYCIECDQHICDRCSVIHKKAKVSRSHQVVLESDIPSSKGRLRLGVSYCDQHPADQNILYCYDCKLIMCHKCVSKHNQHELSDVGDSAEKLSKQLQEDVNKISIKARSKEEEIIQLETDIKKFKQKVSSVQRAISQRCEQLISLVESHKSQLTKELHQFRDKVVKKMETEREEMERQFVIRESFKKYCQEMLNKGTACDISRAAHNLHAKAEELVKTQDKPDSHKLSGVEVKFKPSPSTTDSGKNFFGELHLNVSDEKLSTIKDEKLDKCTVSHKCKLLHVIGEGSYVGVTVLGKDVFVARKPSQVNVYNAREFTFARSFTMTQSKSLTGIVSCLHNNCLYMSDEKQTIIYKYDVTNGVVTNYSINGKCFGLSVTKSHNVLVSLSSAVEEYTTDGRWIRKIRLANSIDGPCHCVELSTGNYVVCHEGKHVYRVCVVDQFGHIIQIYTGPKGSGFEEMYNPVQLAVDRNDNVLVVDRGNNRMELLSSTLSYLGHIVIPDHKLNDPYIIHLDELSHRLYVAEWKGRRMFVLDVDINNYSRK